MKHITMEYGQETNLMESSVEEFYVLKCFLEKHGVLIRMCSLCDGIVVWQARNPYQVWANLNASVCPSTKKIADEEMEDKHWCR